MEEEEEEEVAVAVVAAVEDSREATVRRTAGSAVMKTRGRDGCEVGGWCEVGVGSGPCEMGSAVMVRGDGCVVLLGGSAARVGTRVHS